MAKTAKTLMVFHNRTRRSKSIPKKLLQEGKFYLIPIYYLLLTSELAREGIANSGSYRFADHIYQSKPKGKFGIGYAIDALLLNLKSSRSFRTRYLNAKQEIHRFIAERGKGQERVDILAVPCGLARELFEVAQELKHAQSPHYKKAKWHGLDLDRELVSDLIAKSREHGHEMYFRCGDALLKESYQKTSGYDIILSIGFTEFLDDERVVAFYRLARENLKNGGKFITSGMTPHRFSEYLMKHIAELQVFYRSEEQLRRLAQRAGFVEIHSYRDQYKLQTMLICTKK